MSHSPIDAGGPADTYEAGWNAVNKLLRRGHSWSGHERDCAYLNTGEDRFADVSVIAGLDFDGDGRAAARVDWDDDGDLDLFLASRTGPGLRYLRNGFVEPGRSLSLELVGTDGNRDAIGARVELFLRDRELPRIAGVRAGEGFLAQSSKRVHLGLAPGEEPVRVRVRWPGAAAEDFPVEDLFARGERRLVLTQGGGVAPRPRPEHKGLSPSVPIPPRASSTSRVVLASPVPLPRLGWSTPEGRSRTLFGMDPEAAGPGEPLLVSLWASWCAPCIGELRELDARAGEVTASGLTVLALSVDEAETRADAEDFLAGLGWPFARGYATPATVDVLDGLRGILLEREDRLKIPTAFLVDGAGRLRVLYQGPIGVDTLLEDLRLCEADATTQRAAATPFPGRWRDEEPPAADLAVFEQALLRRGLGPAAREYHLGRMERVSTDEAELRWRFGRTLGEGGRYAEAAEHYRAALRADPYLVDAWRDLAVVLFHLDDHDAAAAAYEESLRLLPDDGTTIYQLGLTHLRRDDAAAVRHQIERLRALGDEARADELERWLGRLPAAAEEPPSDAE